MALRTLAELLSLIGGQLTTHDRSARLDSVADHLRWLSTATIPSAYLVELFPDLSGQAVTLTADVRHEFELPYGERVILAALAGHIRAERIFEFGTFTGATTRLLAEACPEAEVETIDLPDGTEWDPWIADVVGAAFRDLDLPITQHRANSLTFDFESRRHSYDLVFVDASHEHPDVLSDSRNALELIRPDGLIVWDDYKPGTTGVVSALNELYREGLQVVRIAGSRLAIHSPRGFDLPPTGRPWRMHPDRPRPNLDSNAG
jgi:hypothetical protein